MHARLCGQAKAGAAGGRRRSQPRILADIVAVMNQGQLRRVDTQALPGEGQGCQGMDMDHIGESREFGRKLLVNREVTAVVRRLVVQGPDQGAAGVEEGL